MLFHVIYQWKDPKHWQRLNLTRNVRGLMTIQLHQRARVWGTTPRRPLNDLLTIQAVLCSASLNGNPRWRACVASSRAPAPRFAVIEPLVFREKSTAQCKALREGLRNSLTLAAWVRLKQLRLRHFSRLAIAREVLHAGFHKPGCSYELSRGLESLLPMPLSPFAKRAVCWFYPVQCLLRSSYIQKKRERERIRCWIINAIFLLINSPFFVAHDGRAVAWAFLAETRWHKRSPFSSVGLAKTNTICIGGLHQLTRPWPLHSSLQCFKNHKQVPW